MDNILPHLLYTNAKTIQHNKNIFDKTSSQTFTFFAQDVHFETCPSHCRLSIIPSQKLVCIMIC